MSHIEGSMKISFVSENEEIKVVQEKIKNVPKDQIIKLDDDTIYRFSFSINHESLKLELNEIGAFAPYIYRRNLTLDEITTNYPMFRSCANLEAVEKHIRQLFKDNKIKLRKDREDSIILELTVYMISEIKKIEIEVYRIMTTKKDEALIKLYQIQKDEIKLLKEIDNLLKKSGENGNNLIGKINEIKNKYQEK